MSKENQTPPPSEELLALQAQLAAEKAAREHAEGLLRKNDIEPLEVIILDKYKVESVEEGHPLHGKTVKFKTGNNWFRLVADDMDKCLEKLTPEEVKVLFTADSQCSAAAAVKIPFVMELLAARNYGGLEVTEA